MGWVTSPTIPGLNLPASLSWEGPIPAEGLPAPPPTSVWADIAAGIPYITAPVLPAAPALPAAPRLSEPDAPGTVPGLGGEGGSELATVILLALGCLAVSRMKGLRL